MSWLRIWILVLPFLTLTPAILRDDCIAVVPDVHTIHISTPRDGATVGMKTSLSFAIYAETMCRSFPVPLTKNVDPSEYLVRYLVNDKEMYVGEAKSMVYQSVVIGDVLLGDGVENIVAVELYHNNGLRALTNQSLLAQAQVRVFSHRELLSPTAFNSILQGTVTRTAPDQGFTHLIYGFYHDKERLKQFSILDPERLILVDPDIPRDCSGLPLAAFSTVECFTTMDSISAVPYFDSTFISLSAFADINAFLVLQEELSRRTRNSLWVFRPKNDTRFPRNELVSRNFELARFHTDENKRKNDTVFEGTDAWLLDTSLLSFLKPMNKATQWKSRLVHSQYEVANSRILLSNVCFQPERKYLFIFQDNLKNVADNLVNVTHLAEDESRGFLYTGWELRHLDSASQDAQTILRLTDYKFLPGVSAISIGVVDTHLVHGTEPIVQLLGNIPDYFSGSHAQGRQLQIDRILFPLLSIHPPFRWTKTFSALVNSQRRERGLKSASVLFKEHMLQIACYENVLVLGRANPHIKYWPSDIAAIQFKIFVLKHLQDKILEKVFDSKRSRRLISISPDASDDFLFPIARLTSSLDGGVHVHRVIRSGNEVHQRLRVTWILRAGSTRRVLNFPDIQRMLLKTGLVDVRWFLAHILYFENLDFFDQVYILNRTDILISTHSAGIFNGVFMQKGSAAIQIFNSRFVEFVFTPPLRQAGVTLINVPSFSTSSHDYGDFANCLNASPSCWNTSSIFDAGSINCWAIRQCSVVVNLEHFIYAFYEAYYHVLSEKYASSS